ncbi:uncharacterized protein LOC122335393 [Puntigrus tetrazona]|uniref:uncharacterized protein LOC122335393 n=1 Tax=Puntigrus tetrazona TaxID=1606681 RepID=UPI001C8AC80F|nr:uncharacterized protein LOC122335393 [Puntigrus tetrazona]
MKSQCDLYYNRPEVTVIKGTLIINPVNRTDSGNYRLTVYNSDGSETSRDLHVIVEGSATAAATSSLTSSLTSASTQTSDYGLDRFCSFDQSDPCYTALGHKLNLLMVNASEYDLKIQKRINNPLDDPVCRVRNGTMKRSECDLYRNRPEVTVIKGTLIINPVNRTDSGNYRLTLLNSEGSETSRDLQVIVEGSSSAAVTSSLTSTLTSSLTSSLTSAVTSSTQTPERVSVVFVLVWCLQMMVLLGLLGAFHIYMRHTSGKKQEDQEEDEKI